jgi:hypothetical protein
MIPPVYHLKQDEEIKHISDIHTILTLPLNSGPGSIDESQLKTKLLNKNLQPLKFVCYTLKLQMVVQLEQGLCVLAKTKNHFVDILIRWVSLHPPLARI